MSASPYLDRLHPVPLDPDWTSADEVTDWIEATRTRAFFGGARHDEISREEAHALVAAILRWEGKK